MCFIDHHRRQFPLTALREIKIMKLFNHTNVLSLREVVHSAGAYVCVRVCV
jgi:hypothetical protein